MADYVHLLGAEDVRSAASQMREAAERMNQAASAIDYAFQQQRVFMDDWLARFEQSMAAVGGRHHNG